MRIIPCRSSISERFPIASFIVEVPPERVFEVVCTTDPSLLRADQRHRRTLQNFYTSRGDGLLRAPAGQATWLLPPEQLRRFAGARDLFYTVGTYGNPQGDDPRFLAAPHESPSVSISPDFTGRSLDRSRLGGYEDGSGRYGAPSAPLVWGGDFAEAAEREREDSDALAADEEEARDLGAWDESLETGSDDEVDASGLSDDDEVDASGLSDDDEADASGLSTDRAREGSLWVKTTGMPGDPLAAHGSASSGNMFLQWNLGDGASELDVCVYCHGFSSQKPDRVLQAAKIGPEGGTPPLKEPDFCIADMQQSLSRRPSLLIVPRGKGTFRQTTSTDKATGKSTTRSYWAYHFPALLDGGLERLVRWCLDRVAEQAGRPAGSLRHRRLGIAGHSGGGSAVQGMLASRLSVDPDHVFLIDAEPSGAAAPSVQSWLTRRMQPGTAERTVFRYVYHLAGSYQGAGRAWERFTASLRAKHPDASARVRSEGALGANLHHGTIPIWMLPALVADPAGDVVDARKKPTWPTAWQANRGCSPATGAYRGADDDAEGLDVDDQVVSEAAPEEDGLGDAIDLHRGAALDADGVEPDEANALDADGVEPDEANALDSEEEGSDEAHALEAELEESTDLGEESPAPHDEAAAFEESPDDPPAQAEGLEEPSTAERYGAPEGELPLRDGAWRSDDVEESLEFSESLGSMPRLTERDKLHIVAVVAVSESGASLYAAFNDDREYRTPSHPAYQKYHIGVSWGLVQFTQRSGNLGKVLANAQTRDAAAFARVFGAHAGEVLRVTNAHTEEERVAAVDGEPLWSRRWRERFDLAATLPSFRHAQHEVSVKEFVDPNLDFARDLGLVTPRALAMLLDRCVHMGNGGGRAWVARHAGPIRDAATLDRALRALGHGTLLSFQKVTPGLKSDGQWGARSHAAITAALRALGPQSPVAVPGVTAMLDALVKASAAVWWGHRLARLRAVSDLSDASYQVR